jgi:hypothetical protein
MLRLFRYNKLTCSLPRGLAGATVTADGISRIIGAHMYWKKDKKYDIGTWNSKDTA